MHIDFVSETQHTKGLGRSTGLKNACCSYIGLEHSSQHLHQVAHKQVAITLALGVCLLLVSMGNAYLSSHIPPHMHTCTQNK